MSMGKKIVEARKNKGMTAEALGAMIGLSKGAIWKIENDQLKGGPDPETIVRISEALNDTSILTHALQENPIFQAIVPRIFPDLNNIRRGPKAIFTRISREAGEARDAAAILAALFSNPEPERIPGYEQTFKIKMEQLVDIKRGIEIAEFELIATRIVTEEWIREVYEHRQRKREERGHREPEAVCNDPYGIRARDGRGESPKVKEGLGQGGFWSKIEEQAEAATGCP
jgi:transcriptional regulator with XRE-family HTH domain